MTELNVVGLDRAVCRRMAGRLRALADRAGLPVVVRETTDAIDVQRLGQLGRCIVLADGRWVAVSPFPDDTDLANQMAAWAPAAPADRLAATA